MTPLDVFLICVMVIVTALILSVIAIVTALIIEHRKQLARDATPTYEKTGRSFRVVWEPEDR